jgi:TrmH family RNA methyltransferase
LTVRSARVKAARRLGRRAARTSERRFLAEGPQAVREALGVPGCVVEIFSTADAAVRHSDIHQSAVTSGVAWHLAGDDAVASLADSQAPQGLVAVCGAVDVPLEGVVAWAGVRLVAVCANVRDPGNAGTVIRCADAAGADAVVLTGSSVDPYNGKAVRASAGSLFHLPVVVASSPQQVVATLRHHAVQVLAADGGGSESLDDVDPAVLAAPTAWLFGNEAWGLPVDLAGLADRVVRVPIYGRAESLNLATAAAVCLYESARRQRHTVDTYPVTLRKR